MKKKTKYIVIAAAVLGTATVSGCGVSHKSPEGVVRSLIEAYAKGKENKAKDCYGAKKDADADLQAQIDATIQYFQAFEAKEVAIDQCDIISETEEYTYVYITYDMLLENEEEYPCISTYMVGKENDDYYVLPPAQVTEDMSRQAATEYAEFMESDVYKDYVTKYDTFMKKNPGYEEKIAGKLN